LMSITIEIEIGIGQNFVNRLIGQNFVNRLIVQQSVTQKI